MFYFTYKYHFLANFFLFLCGKIYSIYSICIISVSGLCIFYRVYSNILRFILFIVYVSYLSLGCAFSTGCFPIIPNKIYAVSRLHDMCMHFYIGVCHFKNIAFEPKNQNELAHDFFKGPVRPGPRPGPPDLKWPSKTPTNYKNVWKVFARPFLQITR